MRGLILAAGFGTRMRPLSEHLPKALVPVCGQPLLARTLDLFHRQGMGPLMANSHYLHEQLVAFSQASSVPFEISHEKERIRGTGGALWQAREFLGGADAFFVCNAEPLKELDLKPLVQEFLSSGALCGLVSVPVPGEGTIFGAPQTHEYLGTRDDNLEGQTVDEFCFVGIAFYRSKAQALLTEEDFSVVPLWRRIQETGGSTIIVPTPADVYWRDIGTPAQLAQVHFDVLAGVSPYCVPGGLQHDRERQSAYPDGSGGRVGRQVWLEVAEVPEGATLERCVVLAGSILERDHDYTNMLVTPWGATSFG